MALLRKYVLNNLGLKVVSLLLAVGLWLAVARDRTAEVALDVPIEFHNIPNNLEISSEHIPEAQVRVRGPARLVRQLQKTDVHTEIDLSGAKVGERTFDLTAQQVDKIRNLEVDVVQVIPSQLHLNFDTRMTRQVEVHPRIVGNFAPGYQISQVVAVPPTITIGGPRGRVARVDAAITDPIDATGTMKRATFSTHAYVSDPLVQVVDPSPVSVTVIMEKAPAQAEAPPPAAKTQ